MVSPLTTPCNFDTLTMETLLGNCRSIEDTPATIDDGPAYGFRVHPSKTKAWWPKMDVARLRGQGTNAPFPCALATNKDNLPVLGVRPLSLTASPWR